MTSSGPYSAFLDIWHLVVLYGSYLFLAISVLIVIFYNAKLASLKENKKKYDYISNYEVVMYFYSILALAIAIGLFLNSLEPDTVRLNITWFFVRLFITICISTLIAYVSSLILRYTYPSKLDRKLKRLRFKPRVNHKTGNHMRLLTEDEEDVHLDEGMQAEENVFSVDYDVWLDEESGHVKIEKYPGHLQALECDRCGFQTLRLEREEIIKPATEQIDGELVKHYKCTYCGRVRRIPKKIARFSKSGVNYRVPAQPKFREDEQKAVQTVEVRIASNNGDSRSYDFQSIEQARKFLNEFEVDQVEE